jgi:hypothetical protein
MGGSGARLGAASLKKEERVMIAPWKSPAVLSIGLAAFVWLDPHNGSGASEIAQ